MGLSDRDRKMLWARAGNRCSYRYGDEICNELLFLDGGPRPVNKGEECHIVGEKPGTARYVDVCPGRDAYSNRVLMCRNHHKVIDDAEDMYTIEVLREMKALHEEQIKRATEQGGDVAKPSTLQELCDELLIVNQLSFHHPRFQEWHSTVRVVLRQRFGEDSYLVSEYDKIAWRTSDRPEDAAEQQQLFLRCCAAAQGLLEAAMRTGIGPREGSVAGGCTAGFTGPARG
jgi:hypothetical protein